MPRTVTVPDDWLPEGRTWVRLTFDDGREVEVVAESVADAERLVS